MTASAQSKRGTVVIVIAFLALTAGLRVDGADRSGTTTATTNFLRCSVTKPRADGSTKAPAVPILCDYRVGPEFAPSQLLLKVGDSKISLPRESVTRYPAAGQRTALLLIFDVSDPARQKTVSEVYPKIVSIVSQGGAPHVEIGVSTFSDRLIELRSIGPGLTGGAVDEAMFQATGAATEMNRMILEAVDRLAKHPAERRALVVVSDGKAEDTEYSLEDVAERSLKAEVPIIALGIAERPSETPALQSLRKLAEKTGGRFIDLSNRTVPDDLRGSLLEFTDGGGRVYFDGSPFHGTKPISVTLTDKSKRNLMLTSQLEFPDTRSAPARVLDFGRMYWWVIVLGLAAVAGSAAILVRRRSRQAAQHAPLPVLAELREMSGVEVVHEIRKSGVTIGRDQINDIVLRNSSVSSRHAELHRARTGAFILSDLGSTNGITLNGERVTAAELRSGDIVEIAEVRLRFTLHG